jgi:hypothetical protein
MGDCCLGKVEDARQEKLKVLECPQCQGLMKPIDRNVLIHQVMAPLNQSIPVEIFFFCSKTNCRAVYFSPSGFVVETTDMRYEISEKLASEERTICYCYGITYRQVVNEIKKDGHSTSKEFVVEQTKLKNCACDVRNPSGRCCLKEFPK